RFRADLFYRIGVLRLHVPPLRERMDDLPELAQAHLAPVAPGAQPAPQGFGHGVVERLAAYRWPGNVRELHSLIERAAHRADGPLITADDLPDDHGSGREDRSAG